MDVDLTLMFQFGPTSGFSCACQDRFDHLFPQNGRKAVISCRPSGTGLKRPRVFDFAPQVLATQFLQVIGSLAGRVKVGSPPLVLR
jgi:hypothetical protein